LWLDGDADPVAATAQRLAEHIERFTPEQRLGLRVADEQLHPLAIEARPAPVGQFSGPYGERELLPEPAPEADSPDAPSPTKQATPTLDTIGQPLHTLARQGRLERAYARDELLERLLALLASSAGPVVLVGPQGVGKSAVLDELAHRLLADDLPASLRDRPYWFADASRLVASDGGFGSWQKQVVDVVAEVSLTRALWNLGRVVDLLDAGKSAQSEQNVAQMLKPVLGSGDLTVVGEARDTDWATLELRNPGLARLFTPLRVEEPAPSVTRRIVGLVADQLEAAVDEPARDTVVELARRYGQRRSLVGTSLQLLRRATDTAIATALGAEPPRSATLGRHDVVRHVCEETGLPEFLVRDDLPLDPADVTRRFRARILGQDAVIDRMADLVARIKAGVADSERPLGAYLFVGPTGVGKTETVKTLAELLYGRSDRVLRFDMSEYQGADCLDRLLGVGEVEGLVAKVARLPFAIVLLDELEKAHPAVFDVLLQVLGEARLSDRGGRTADFRNAVILMTSNLGVDTFRRPTGFGADVERALADHLHAEVKRFFRPEFVGRLDDVVAFEPLGAEAIELITHRELDRVRGRYGLAGRGLALQLDDEVPGWLAARGVDLRYGARPLKRVIERQLVAPIGRHLSDQRGVPPGVRVVAADSLAVKNTEAGAEPVGGQRVPELGPALELLSLLRHRLGRWQHTERYRTLLRSVQLVDRLASTRIFWRDEEAARRRLAAVDGPRAVVEQLRALASEVEALEDLALETWAGFGGQPDVLREEAAAAEQTYLALEWTLAGAGLPITDKATLWVRGDGDGAKLEPLVFAYARLCLDRGWTLTCFLSSGKKLSEEPFTHFYDFQTTYRKKRDSALPLRIVVDGPHCFTWLTSEAGVHEVVVDSARHQLLLRVEAGALRRLPDEPAPLRKQRVIHLGRKEVRDTLTKRVRGIGKLHETLAAMARERMLRRVFGTGWEAIR